MREGWVEKNLEDLADEKKAIVSGPFGSNLKVSDYRDSGVPIIRLQNVGKGYFIEKDIKYIDKEKAEELKSHSFVVGDIVLAKLGIPIGKTCIVPDSFNDGIILADIVRIRPNRKRVDYNFLEYFLNTNLSVSQLTRNISGATRPRVNLSNVRSIVVPIPALPEQKQIVKTLDLAFGQINQAKANLEQNLANAKELFASKLNEVFSQRGEGWEEKRLGDVCENLDNQRIPITKNKREEGKIPYYGASGIVDYVNDYIFDEDLLLVSEDGANLLARTYPIAFSISGQNWVNNHAHVLKFENMINQKFIEYYLNSIKLDEYVSGMAQPKLNQRMLNSILIPFPSIDIQKYILETIENLNVSIETLQTHYQQNLNNLEELKKSILEKAFKGEL